MTWEETIKFIRTQPEYKSLVENAYFEEDLKLNVERFRQGAEFRETVAILNDQLPQRPARLLDVGSGNGISAISFALAGFEVTAVEPDASKTIGAGAIRELKEYYQLTNLQIQESYAEDLALPENSYDVVYVRQAMHHAYNLTGFVQNLSRFLRPGGLLFTVRDHVILDDKDKQWFLDSHPLHKFYGGENAFTSNEYQNAMSEAGLEVVKVFRYYDSVINYFPLTAQDLEQRYVSTEEWIHTQLVNKIGALGNLSIIRKLNLLRLGFNRSTYFDEQKIPGRLHSYLAKKI